MTATRPRGRPPEGVRVDVRIPADMLADVDKLAAMCSQSRAEALRDLIRQGLFHLSRHHIDGTANERHP